MVNEVTPGAGAQRPRIVIIGAGFAGYHAAHGLSRSLGDSAEIVLINPMDYFLYLPLLPEVAGGVLEPRRICVSLARTLPRVRIVLGTADAIDVAGRTVGWTDPEGRRGSVSYDRLLVTAGSTNKLLPIPGVAEHAHGFRGVAEALFLRDHIVRQLELAAVTDDAAERHARCTFVVVGAGYTGTEVAAQGQLFTKQIKKGLRPLRDQPVRWLLLDLAPRVLPELDRRLSKAADKVLRRRGVEVRMGVSIADAMYDGVKLTDGETVSTRSLIWCVGVRPDPTVDGLNLPTNKGRLVVDEYLTVPDHPDVFACGDCAAVPDLTRPGEVTGMTAQHAERQGKTAAVNIAASLGHGQRKAYKHHDLGFLVDLGGLSAAANPLRIPLSGLPAKLVTRAYHLISMPGNRVRTAGDWTFNMVAPASPVQLGLVRGPDVPLDVDRAPTA